MAGQGPRRAAQLELPPHTVALAALGRQLAILAVESIDQWRAELRVDVYTRGEVSEQLPGGLRLVQVLRRVDALPSSPDAGPSHGPPPRFAPEVALAPGRPWLAIHGFGLAVFDWRTGKQRPLRDSVAQKLAPRAP